LQEQICNEFTSAQQLAKRFYSQSVEERNHAMMLVQHLLDRDVGVEIPGVDAVRNRFDRRAMRSHWRWRKNVRSPSKSGADRRGWRR
jgi:ferritin